ncbi:hypothetical protein AOQ84DRAFT_436962 [Glonium stellatum]|uniref:Uncharacterized protein n=1 Tax=Glonium stellatum TaxID=574774 RepID=A0A8E2F8F0_9PEZI|nr:hypothetical protein AOQ84DRAFT_436962 [Glonium stellatum]
MTQSLTRGVTGMRRILRIRKSRSLDDHTEQLENQANGAFNQSTTNVSRAELPLIEDPQSNLTDVETAVNITPSVCDVHVVEIEEDINDFDLALTIPLGPFSEWEQEELEYEFRLSQSKAPRIERALALAYSARSHIDATYSYMRHVGLNEQTFKNIDGLGFKDDSHSIGLYMAKDAICQRLVSLSETLHKIRDVFDAFGSDQIRSARWAGFQDYLDYYTTSSLKPQRNKNSHCYGVPGLDYNGTEHWELMERAFNPLRDILSDIIESVEEAKSRWSEVSLAPLSEVHVQDVDTGNDSTPDQEDITGWLEAPEPQDNVQTSDVLSSTPILDYNRKTTKVVGRSTSNLPVAGKFEYFDVLPDQTGSGTTSANPQLVERLASSTASIATLGSDKSLTNELVALFGTALSAHVWDAWTRPKILVGTKATLMTMVVTMLIMAGIRGKADKLGHAMVMGRPVYRQCVVNNMNLLTFSLPQIGYM